MCFLDFLDDLSKHLSNNFLDINRGGCGLMAVIFGREIVKHAEEIRFTVDPGLNSKTVCLDSIKQKLNQLKNKSVYDWNNVGVEFGHIWVEFKWNGIWYALDTHCGITKCENLSYNRHKGFMTLDEVAEISRKNIGWNYDFNRAQTPAIRKTVQDKFKQYRADNRNNVNKATKAA